MNSTLAQRPENRPATDTGSSVHINADAKGSLPPLTSPWAPQEGNILDARTFFKMTPGSPVLRNKTAGPKP